ncbi:AH receptor-interacting protein [Periplaneta americana]|uniref:AH receptor-interacting protein n=1 Tax=Periplaneta americana TaxID=6978 RepID=UPI0037E8CF94
MEAKSNAPLITKNILHAGSKSVSFVSGTKVFFHFQTIKCDEERTIIDDSRKLGKPMELVLGKKFSLEVWETIVQMMALHEVASFTVDKSLVSGYPFISKTWREAGKPKEKQHRSHCCGVTLQNEGIGYDDLNQLIKQPCDLEFILELIKVAAPEDYEKESWQMNEEEKLNAIPSLHANGNVLFRNKEYKAASDKYAQAIGMLEQLMLMEKPGDEEWIALEKQKLPLLLNFAQCKLYEKEYYKVIEHCSTVLKSEPDNVKALFRRAKAHVGAWNPREAREDFTRVMELDQSLLTAVQKELKQLDELKKKRDEEDRDKLKGKIF